MSDPIKLGKISVYPNSGEQKERKELEDRIDMYPGIFRITKTETTPITKGNKFIFNGLVVQPEEDMTITVNAGDTVIYDTSTGTVVKIVTKDNLLHVDGVEPYSVAGLTKRINESVGVEEIDGGMQVYASITNDRMIGTTSDKNFADKGNLKTISEPEEIELPEKRSIIVTSLNEDGSKGESAFVTAKENIKISLPVGCQVYKNPDNAEIDEIFVPKTSQISFTRADGTGKKANFTADQIAERSAAIGNGFFDKANAVAGKIHNTTLDIREGTINMAQGLANTVAENPVGAAVVTGVVVGAPVISYTVDQAGDMIREAFLGGMLGKLGYAGKTLEFLAKRSDLVLGMGWGTIDAFVNGDDATKQEIAKKYNLSTDDKNALNAIASADASGRQIIGEVLGDMPREALFDYLKKNGVGDNKIVKWSADRVKNILSGAEKLGEKLGSTSPVQKLMHATQTKTGAAIVKAVEEPVEAGVNLLKSGGRLIGKGFALAGVYYSASDVYDGISQTVTNYERSTTSSGKANAIMNGVGQVGTDAIVLGATAYTAAAAFGVANIWNPVGWVCLATVGVATITYMSTGKSPGQVISGFFSGSANESNQQKIVQNSTPLTEQEMMLGALAEHQISRDGTAIISPSLETREFYNPNLIVRTDGEKIPTAQGLVMNGSADRNDDEKVFNKNTSDKVQILAAAYKQLSNSGEAGLSEREQAKLNHLKNSLGDVDINFQDGVAVITDKHANKTFTVTSKLSEDFDQHYADEKSKVGEDGNIFIAAMQTFLKDDGKLSQEEIEKLRLLGDKDPAGKKLGGIAVNFSELSANKIHVWDEHSRKTYTLQIG